MRWLLVLTLVLVVLQAFCHSRFSHAFQVVLLAVCVCVLVREHAITAGRASALLHGHVIGASLPSMYSFGFSMMFFVLVLVLLVLLVLLVMGLTFTVASSAVLASVAKRRSKAAVTLAHVACHEHVNVNRLWLVLQQGIVAPEAEPAKLRAQNMR